MKVRGRVPGYHERYRSETGEKPIGYVDNFCRCLRDVVPIATTQQCNLCRWVSYDDLHGLAFIMLRRKSSGPLSLYFSYPLSVIKDIVS